MKNFIQKSLIALAVFFATATPTLAFNFTSASAAGRDLGGCDYFLGMTSWDCGIADITDETTLKNSIWQIALNVAIDISVISAYLVIGYVIYGGYLYIFSGGEPSKVATGKKALYQAFLGLAIVMSANIIMSSIRVALIGDKALGNCVTEKCISAGEMVTNAIQWVIAIAGIISAIFIVYGGINYISSSGDPGKTQAAKRMITYALIGLIIVAIAEIITSFVGSTIREANSSTSMINQTIISKEVYETKMR